VARKALKGKGGWGVVCRIRTVFSSDAVVGERGAWSVAAATRLAQ